MDKTIDHRLAWLAGIIDGEGCVRFTSLLARHKGRGGRTWMSCEYMVDVANTDGAMLAEIMAIADVLGIKYGYYLRAGLNRRFPNRKPQHRVSFHSRDSCEAILVAVFPYLVTKRPQAELMLRAISRRKKSGRHYRDPGFIRAHLDEEFQRLVAESKVYNQRGARPNDVRLGESARRSEV